MNTLSVGKQPPVTCLVGSKWSAWNHLRRLLFITSFYLYLNQVRSIADSTVLEGINERFGLAWRSESLMIPALLTPVLWRNCHSLGLVHKYQRDELSLNSVVELITREIPRVGRYPGISDDIKMVCLSAKDC